MALEDDVSIEAYLVHEGNHCIRFVPERSIAYFFIPSARDAINAPWNGKHRFGARGVYFITRTGEAFRAIGYRSLAEVQRRPGSASFLKIHPAALLNVRYVHSVNPYPKRREVTLQLSGARHTIFATRRPFTELRERKANGG